MDLKRISCRIEWSLSQVRSLKHARVLILILFTNHLATIVAYRCQGVNRLCITNKTGPLQLQKWVFPAGVKHLKQDCYSKNCGLKQLNPLEVEKPIYWLWYLCTKCQYIGFWITILAKLITRACFGLWTSDKDHSILHEMPYKSI